MGSCWIGLIEYLLNSEDGKSLLMNLKYQRDLDKNTTTIALGYKNNNLVNTPERRKCYYLYKIGHKNKD